MALISIFCVILRLVLPFASLQTLDEQSPMERWVVFMKFQQTSLIVWRFIRTSHDSLQKVIIPAS